MLSFSWSATVAGDADRASRRVISGATGSTRMLSFSRSATVPAMRSSISPVISGATGSTRMLSFSRSATVPASGSSISPRKLRRDRLDTNTVLQLIRHRPGERSSISPVICGAARLDVDRSASRPDTGR